MDIAIIGAGAWGRALANAAARAGHNVIVWANDIAIKRVPTDSFRMTYDITDTARANAWILTTPSEYFTKTMAGAYASFHRQPLIICVKGMDKNEFMSEILHNLGYPDSQIGVLAGPQFAAGVAAGERSVATIAGPKRVTDTIYKIFAGQIEMIRTLDTRGAEICGAGKNAAAVYAGYLDGMGTPENERAAEITAIWNEIVTLGRAMGAKTETFLGPCGLGDLLLTATSKTSRNYSAGIALSQNKDTDATTEGIEAARGLYARARAKHIPVPVLSRLCGIIR